MVTVKMVSTSPDDTEWNHRRLSTRKFFFSSLWTGWRLKAPHNTVGLVAWRSPEKEDGPRCDSFFLRYHHSAYDAAVPQ